MKMNQIGIDEAKSKELAAKLNLLLSDFQLFYINARGFHWNIKGDKFFELHVKFEELYT
ncbi:MAG: DNA starvation/stationary phase protection protein, partial [Pedobacter sp.]